MFSINEVVIPGLFLTASVLTVVQADGWSKPHYQGELAIKYRANDQQQFCRIYNFKASYRNTTPILIVFVIPTKDGCEIVLNSMIQDKSRKINSKLDSINVSKEDFR